MITFKELMEDNSNRLYRIWANMKSRVNNPTGTHKYYKGLDYHNDWEEYDTFEKWSLKNGYADDLEMDREDVTLGYSPSNCRWLSKSGQQRNKGIMANNSSGFRGIVNNNGTWRAKTKVDGKNVHIGNYPTKEEASKAFEDFTRNLMK